MQTITCGCGSETKDVFVSVEWVHQGKNFKITNVPRQICSNTVCERDYSDALTELRLSALAEKMENEQEYETDFCRSENLIVLP